MDQKWLERQDQMMADHQMIIACHGRKMVEFDERQAKLQASQAKTEATLRRAIGSAVQDGRRQRKWNAQFDEKMTRIVGAQLRNEELLKAFLERGGNGKH